MSHRLTVVMLLFAAAALTCCTRADGKVANPAENALHMPGTLPALASLPPDTNGRQASEVTYHLLAGPPQLESDPADVQYSADQLQLSTISGDLAWAIYSIGGLPSGPGNHPYRLEVAATQPYWIGLSDYSAGSWQILPPNPSGVYNFNGSAMTSAGGVLHVALIAWQSAATFDKVDLVTDEAGELELWLYLQQNLLVNENVTAAIDLAEEAAAAGYTTIVLADYKLSVLDLQVPRYGENLQAFTSACAGLGIRVIPVLAPIGYSEGFFAHDPNLIEAQPVIDCRFLVSGGKADAITPPTTAIANGGFEDYAGDQFDSWNQMDGAGASTFADTSVFHSGAASIRFAEFLSGNPSGNARIRQDLQVDPWHCYALSFWLRTDNVSPTGTLWARAFSPAIEFLSYNLFQISATQDWQQYYLIFNSQEHTSVPIYLGIWAGQSGQFWIDDVEVRNAGLVNIVRRDGAPLTVTSDDGAVTYTEGADYEYVSDPLLGEDGPWTGIYTLYHERPLITITPGSAISEGQELLVDYYHATFVYQMQGSCCLSEQGVFDIIETTMQGVHELIDPGMVFIGVDELRVANWCAECQAQSLTSGALLAAATQRIDAIAASVDPALDLIVWSDMYDPNHNAHDDYYLCSGTMAGSWDGLPSDWDVANWHQSGARQESIDFFSDRGNRQVLAGYYDRGIPDPVLEDWLNEAKGKAGVYAVMYTTWYGNFTNIAAWAQQVRAWEAAQQ